MASLANSKTRQYSFGDVVVDLDNFCVIRQGEARPLAPRAFELLVYLMENPDRVIEKHELFESVWKESFVTDNALTQTIREVRRAIGDNADSPQYIMTIPKRGYRFIAPVCPAQDEPADLIVERHSQLRMTLEEGETAADASLGQPRLPGALPARAHRTRKLRPLIVLRSSSLRRITMSVGIGLLGGALIVGVFLELNIGGAGEWLWQSNPPIHSLAVLPLENLSGDPAQDYFADGMTDALITDLSKIGALRVISRTSAMHYKGTKKSLPQIAKELNVDGVVEGSVARLGNRVRITAQLLQASTDQHLWAETYELDLGDVLKLQDEMARTIAQQVRIRLTPQQHAQLSTAAKVNPDAYETYLRGRYFWNQRTEVGLLKSIEMFQNSINIDPNSALPYAGLADAYLVLDSWTVEAAPPIEITPKAKAAIEKAVQLDPTLAEAHTVLAGLKHGDWDWDEAEAEYRHSIELNPNYAHAHHWYSQYLCELGRFDDGVAEAERAHALDPLNLMYGIDVGMRLYWARRFEEAIAPIQRTLELDSNFGVGHRFLGQVYEQNGRFGEAITELRLAAELSNDNPIDLGALGHVYAVAGKREQALQILEELRQLSSKRYVSSYEFALIYAGLGEPEPSLRWLEKAFQEHSAWMLHLKVDPRLDLLRGEARFHALMGRVGLSP